VIAENTGKLDSMKNRLCAVTITAALLGTTLVASAPETAVAKSLQDEIAQLLVNHPQIRAARKNVSASAEGVNAAFAQFLPTVSAFGDFGYERIDSPGRTSATPDQGPFTTGSSRQTSVTMTQTLFNGYLNEANNINAELTKKSSEISLEETQQGILFEGVSVYLEVLRNLRLVQLAAEKESTIQKQFELEDERVQRGAGIALDVLESKKRLQVAKERRVAFEGSLRDSMTRFVQVFGHEPVIDDMIMPTPPLGLLPEDVESAISAAMSSHPAIHNSETRIEIAQEQRTIAKAAFYPTVDIVAEWSYEDDLSATRGSRRDYTAKVQANWDLFSGFATRAGVAQASHNYLSSIDANNFLKRKIAEETRLASSGLDIARQRVTLLQNAVNIAAEVFTGRRKLREAGKETVINVLDAESGLFDARIQLVSAQHDARVTVYRLLSAMGQLNIDSISQYSAAPAKRNLVAAKTKQQPEISMTVSKAKHVPEPIVKTVSAAPAQKTKTEAPPQSETLQPVKIESIKQPHVPEKRVTRIEEFKHVKAKEKPKRSSTKLAKANATAETDQLAAKSKTDSEFPLNEGKTAPTIAKANYAVDGDPNFTRVWPYE